MARGFLIRRTEPTGEKVEHAYELVGAELILLPNRNIRINISDPNCNTTILQNYESHERRFPEQVFKLLEFPVFCGTYIPSIARPRSLKGREISSPNAEIDNKIAKSYRREHSVISRDIETCFDIASPDTNNYSVFGTQFEKIIYFSCVGIESLFNLIFSSNSININRPNTVDFYKLNSFLRLNEYKLSLPYYPWLPEISPFANWNEREPTQSIPWFYAYNKLKHDKQNNFKHATLANALAAAAAYYTLTYTVFGKQMFMGYLNEQYFFHFEAQPNWNPEEIYFPPPPGEHWKPRLIEWQRNPTLKE